jgi:AcrR family transcriptional regulator
MATRSHSSRVTHARWRRAAPAQRRSHETMARFAEAAEELLRDRPFEDISVHDIVRRAGRPIGSFYARFGSKDALVPFLYERYDRSLGEAITTKLARVAWEDLSFHETTAAIVDLVLSMYDERRWLIRALSLFARSKPEALSAELVQRRRVAYEPFTQILLRHRRRIRHPDPEAAARFGVFLVSSAAREKLLFAQAPLARITPMTRRALRGELVRALTGYLASEVSP